MNNAFRNNHSEQMIAIANQYKITLRQIVKCFVAEIIAINQSINFYLLAKAETTRNSAIADKPRDAVV